MVCCCIPELQRLLTTAHLVPVPFALLGILFCDRARTQEPSPITRGHLRAAVCQRTQTRACPSRASLCVRADHMTSQLTRGIVWWSRLCGARKVTTGTLRKVQFCQMTGKTSPSTSSYWRCSTAQVSCASCQDHEKGRSALLWLSSP